MEMTLLDVLEGKFRLPLVKEVVMNVALRLGFLPRQIIWECLRDTRLVFIDETTSYGSGNGRPVPPLRLPLRTQSGNSGYLIFSVVKPAGRRKTDRLVVSIKLDSRPKKEPLEAGLNRLCYWISNAMR